MDKGKGPSLILLTGCSNFLGEQIFKTLSPHFKVYGLDSQSPNFKLPSQCQFFKVDFGDQKILRGTLKKIQKEFIAENPHGSQAAQCSVIHLHPFSVCCLDPSLANSVAQQKKDLRESQDFFKEEEIFWLTLNESRLFFSQFVFVSSLFVHAPCDLGETINESWPISALDKASKIMLNLEKFYRGHLENLDFQENHSCSLVIMRLAKVYSLEKWTTELGPFIHQLSDGDTYVHGEDVARALAKVVEKKAGLPEESTFLIGEKRTFYHDHLQMVLRGPWERKRPWRRIEDFFLTKDQREKNISHFELNLERAKAWLDWEPRNNILSGLVHFIKKIQKSLSHWSEQGTHLKKEMSRKNFKKGTSERNSRRDPRALQRGF